MRRMTGKDEETADVRSMREVMEFLTLSYGAEVLRKAKRCMVALDGVKIDNLNKREHDISTDSEVYFFPLSCGG
ncbi:MAG: MoaD/ThiS family protein [Clostridiales bacterium]|nr:MoaD/ThiS family protein [Clostridiales bacterium]